MNVVDAREQKFYSLSRDPKKNKNSVYEYCLL